MNNSKIIECRTCGKKVERVGNAKYCHECSAERHIVYKEVKEVGKWVIFSRDEFRCVYCGKSSIEDGVKLVLDHIIPYVDSKDSTIYNLITSCEECNMIKGTMHLPQSVYERIIKLNEKRNKGISREKEKELNKLFDKYYKMYKKVSYKKLGYTFTEKLNEFGEEKLETWLQKDKQATIDDKQM